MSRSFQIPQRWKKELEARKKNSKENQPTKVLQDSGEGALVEKEVKPFARRAGGEGALVEKEAKPFVRRAGGETWEDPSLAEWDPNDYRIFCGDLGNEVTDEMLASVFRIYPSFQKAKVVRDHRDNKSKGYGFVSFKHQDDFVRACREMDGKYVGSRPIKLRKSVWKDRNIGVVRKKQKEKRKLGQT